MDNDKGWSDLYSWAGRFPEFNAAKEEEEPTASYLPEVTK